MDQQLSIICPPADATSFEVDGIRYTQSQGLSTARLRIFQRLTLEFSLNISIKGFIEGIDAVWNAYESGRQATAIHKLGEMRDGINIIGANRIREVELTALFMNSADEDLTKYDFNAQMIKCYGDPETGRRNFSAVHGGFFFVKAIDLVARSTDGYQLPHMEAMETVSRVQPPMPDGLPS